MSQAAILDAAAALSTFMDFKKGKLSVCTTSARRRFSDMAGVFADEEKRAEAEADGDATVYEVFATEPTEQPQATALCYAATVVYPGRVGEEYFMTRGHTHTNEDAPEIYLTVRGQGMMLLQTEENRVQALAMAPGTILYIPGATAHRIVNVSDELLVTFAVYPLAAGLNYERVASHGFKRIIVATPDGPDLVPNPGFQPG
jgi:glucose-6-phosphate isomerase